MFSDPEAYGKLDILVTATCSIGLLKVSSCVQFKYLLIEFLGLWDLGSASGSTRLWESMSMLNRFLNRKGKQKW